MLRYRKKEIITIVFILTFALVMTYFIYYKFKDARDIKYNTNTIDVIFHGKQGDNVNITKVTPVTDSVGLTSKAYNFTISNDTNKNIKYSINIKDNDKIVLSDECGEYQLPKNIVRFSIHKNGEENSIYNLSDLVNGKVLTRVIKANSKEEYTMRFWINRNNTLQSGVELHYHGIIVVDDEGTSIAQL